MSPILDIFAQQDPQMPFTNCGNMGPRLTWVLIDTWRRLWQGYRSTCIHLQLCHRYQFKSTCLSWSEGSKSSFLKHQVSWKTKPYWSEGHCGDFVCPRLTYVTYILLRRKWPRSRFRNWYIILVSDLSDLIKVLDVEHVPGSFDLEEGDRPCVYVAPG